MGVPASGGVPKPIIAVRDGEAGMTFGWPQFLPGGERFLYVVGDSSDDLEGIWMAKADGSDRRRVVPGLSRAEYVPPGWLLFVRDSTLVAQRFDADDGKVSGEPIPVADGLTVSAVGLAEFSASLDGVLAFRTSGGAAEQLAYFDRRGNRDAAAVESGLVGHPAFSPDGRWLAFDKRSDGRQARHLAARPAARRELALHDRARGRLCPALLARRRAPLLRARSARVASRPSSSGRSRSAARRSCTPPKA